MCFYIVESKLLTQTIISVDLGDFWGVIELFLEHQPQFSQFLTPNLGLGRPLEHHVNIKYPINVILYCKIKLSYP